MDIFDVKDKVIVITGAGGVLCSEMARQFAARGAKVALLDIIEENVAKVAEAIKEQSGEAITVKVDVLNKESLMSARQKVIDEYGRVDVLINGAGGNKKDATTSEEISFFNLSEESIKWVLNLNLLGTIMTCQVFGETMLKNESASIINISSMAAITPLTKTISYSAAKAGVSNFTQWLAVHLNQNYSEKLRVNAIAPGFLLTEQNRYLLTDKETGRETERGKKIKDNTPMNRYGRPEELIGAVIWLASGASSFVNGAIIPIDGGFAAYSGV
ncbi:MAG: SDR family oxidoreductase [Firmicutes bacterium]|nr:SDR family oxidoreductase [Bacillota bacterium]